MPRAATPSPTWPSVNSAFESATATPGSPGRSTGRSGQHGDTVTVDLTLQDALFHTTFSDANGFNYAIGPSGEVTQRFMPGAFGDSNLCSPPAVAASTWFLGSQTFFSGDFAGTWELDRRQVSCQHRSVQRLPDRARQSEDDAEGLRAGVRVLRALSRRVREHRHRADHHRCVAARQLQLWRVLRPHRRNVVGDAAFNAAGDRW